MDIEPLEEAINRRLDKYGSHADIEEITLRECSSDTYSEGVEVTIVGDIVPIRPLIQAVEETEPWRIESMASYSDAKIEQIDEDEFEFSSGIVMYCPWIDPVEQGTVFIHS